MASDLQVVQVVIFKLRPDANRERFIELTKQMKAWFLTQDGYVSYEIYDNHPNWADKLVWRDIERAERIKKAFHDSAIFKELEKLLEQDYRGFLGEEIVV